MKRRHFLSGLSGAGFSLATARMARAIADDTRPLLVKRPVDYPGLKEFEINRPGKYALTEDHVQRALFLGIDGHLHSPSGGYMLKIHCGSVELDLRGHLLGADVKMNGVSVFVKGNLALAKRFPKDFWPSSLDNRFVTLRNGTVDLARGNEWTGPAIDFSNEWHDLQQRTVGRPDDDSQAMSAPIHAIRYERNDYRFEQLKVLANNVAMAVEGSHTVIRDCIIESSDKAAIFIAGDHVTIENCEIRLRKPRGKFGEPRAAIVLRDGSNAVIRNNRIRVDYGDDGGDETHCVLVRDGATDVLVEGNTFINIRGEPVTLTEGAKAIVRDNKLEKSWF